ncbi:MAG: squalene synthase HpnC [Betaproteobacteria bacterium]|jgi:squalene synthase HpnC|nr:squalene synthase HpnC [Betaproteobacteria bacterium]
MAVGHYENFPVASVLLPARLRQPVKLIYGFARSADDFADEGDAPPVERLAALEHYRDELRRIRTERGPETPLFRSLSATIAEFRLPLDPFFALLDAFSQDVVKGRYADFAEVLHYCERSANPVGALLLHLFEASTPENLRRSDAICTGLQLANFWQDVELDYRKGRIYLPQDEMARFGVGEHDIAAREAGPAWQNLLAYQIDRTRAMLESGAPLARTLPGRIGLELRMIVQGGLRILEKLDTARWDMFRHRPVLRPADWPLMFWRALRM